MKEFLTAVLITVVLTSLIVGSVIGSVFTLEYYTKKDGCQEYAETLNFEHKYTATAGCILKTEQGWVGKNNYIIIKEEK